MFHDFISSVAAYGIQINVSKSELHAYSNAPHFTYVSPNGETLSTLNSLNEPRNHYKYPGVPFFANPSPQQLQDLLLIAEINTFSQNLFLLPLMILEAVKLTNF